MAIAKSDRPLAVIVFARRPRAGQVKRRLARTLGAKRAARVYARLLDATLQEIEGIVGLRRILMIASSRDMSWFRQVYGRRGWLVGVQASGDRGQRMAAALNNQLVAGYRAVLVGSDIVGITQSDIHAAERVLKQHHDVVIGPAADGGYWLIGLNRTQDSLFEGIRCGSSSVLAQTRVAADESCLSAATIGLRHDVDRRRDLARVVRRRSQRRRARARSSRAT